MKQIKIVLIGGGEIGRKGTEYEIEEIDKEIVKMSEKKNPNFLFIGFANPGNIESYFRVIKRNYRNLGCQCKCILKKELKDLKGIKEKISNADIIYIGGGNTLTLMQYLKKYHIDKLLKKAYNQGKVLCGLSAGAICWCNYGCSDSRKFKKNKNQLVKVHGLSFLPLLLCPHFSSSENRDFELKRMMKNTYRIPGIALDNGSAIQIINDQYRILKSYQKRKLGNLIGKMVIMCYIV